MLTRIFKLLGVGLVILLFVACSWSPRPEGPPVSIPPLVPVAWSQVEGWQEDDPRLVLDAFQKSCSALRYRQEWQQVCAEVTTLSHRSEAEVRTFFESRFAPYQLSKPDNDRIGMVTGYYVPDLRGSRQPSPDFPYPIYRRPDDLLVIDLSDAYPELGKYRLRGRLDEQRVVPYWDRAEIEGDRHPLAGHELLWVEDPVELFFLHIQGSGRILFEDGSRSMVNYAGQNGHPYRSVSQWLIKQEIMTRDEMSMQNIKTWARDNPSQVGDLLNTNPSYIFFREAPGDPESPPGALGVPLTPGRSVAVDRRYTTLGAPVFLATTWPNTDRPLNRLMMAQDTGGAIKGPVRADFFWGMGDDAGSEAGRMKQPLKMWVLLPVEKPAE
jgi:membrane-bound lytic murein transglycosylase A